MRAQTRAHLEQHLIVLLAGRAAEELVFVEPTAGAGGSSPDSDLALATSLAMRMETSYALGQSGLLWMPAESARDLILRPDLQKAVHDTLEMAFMRAKQILSDNRASLDALAQALIANGYLDQAEIGAVLARVPLGTPNPSEASAVEAPTVEAMTADRELHADAADDQSPSTAPDAEAAGSIEA